MPNVLAHIAVQGPLSRTILRDADPRWIYLGLLIPDLPWILRRALVGLGAPVDPLTLMHYVTAQASLALSLVLAGAFALLAARPRFVFALLSLNVLVHLLVDAVERKWGNGVHLFVPFDWTIRSLDLVWPENPVILLLSLAGVGFLVWHWRRGGGRTIPLAPRSAVLRRAPLLALLVGAYLAIPFLWLPAMWEADVRYVRTLQEVEERPGRMIEVDRDRFEPLEEGGRVLVHNVEWIYLEPPAPEETGSVSLRGRFNQAGTVEAEELHPHPRAVRDLLSYAGLLAILFAWLLLPEPWSVQRWWRGGGEAARADG